MIQKRNASDSVLAGKKILVVDDDIRNIFALTSFLERHKMQVVYAEGGEEAMQMLQANADVDVVLMDVMMPGMTGFDLTRRLLSQNATINVLFTSGQMPADQQLEDLGVNKSFDLLHKPFRPDDLVHAVQRALNRPPAPAGPADPESQKRR